MGFAFAGLVCACGAALAVSILLASLLRGAISLTNKFVGPARPGARPGGGIAAWDWDDWDDEYAAPARPRRGPGAVPDPGLFKCMAVVFATALVFALGFVLAGFAAEELIGLRMWRDEAKLVIAVLTLPVADLALTVLLIVMLPTTFWRAVLVALVYNLILLAIALIVAAIVFVLAALIG